MEIFLYTWRIAISSEEVEDDIYLVFNETLDVLEIYTLNVALGWVFFIPYPLNLTMVGNWLNQTYQFDDYVTTGNRLIMMTYGSYTTYYHFLFNDSGILDTYELQAYGNTLNKMEFGDIAVTNDGTVDDNGGTQDENDGDDSDPNSDILDSIPFGAYHLFLISNNLYISIFLVFSIFPIL